VLFAAAARLLSPGGCLLLADSWSGAPADWRVLHTAAEHAGLVFTQHIVAGPAGTDGPRFVFYATEADIAGIADIAGVDAAGPSGSAERSGRRHVRVHRDVLVYCAAAVADGGDRHE
jgi:hypothetical protein